MINLDQHHLPKPSEKNGQGIFPRTKMQNFQLSSGGRQSSLGYLFGSGEAPKPAAAPVSQSEGPAATETVIPKKSASPPVDKTKQIPAGIQGSQANNYFRADGQNTGNFITDWPSTKVHDAPGGGSSLGYLFGDGGSNALCGLFRRTVISQAARF